MPKQLTGGLCWSLIELISLDEAINATFGVNNLLLTGVERMAVAADFYTN
jgi:hypothetical protein